MVGCVAVFIYLFTLVFIDYVKSIQQNKYIDWDVKTITAVSSTILTYKSILIRFVSFYVPIYEKKANKV